MTISAAAANRRRLAGRRLAGVTFTLTVRAAPAAAAQVAETAQSIGASAGRAASLASFIQQDLAASGVADGATLSVQALPAPVVAQSLPAPAYVAPALTAAPTPVPTPVATAAAGGCGTRTRTIAFPQCDLTVVASFSGAGAAARVSFAATMARQVRGTLTAL